MNTNESLLYKAYKQARTKGSDIRTGLCTLGGVHRSLFTFDLGESGAYSCDCDKFVSWYENGVKIKVTGPFDEHHHAAVVADAAERLLAYVDAHIPPERIPPECNPRELRACIRTTREFAAGIITKTQWESVIDAPGGPYQTYQDILSSRIGHSYTPPFQTNWAILAMFSVMNGRGPLSAFVQSLDDLGAGSAFIESEKAWVLDRAIYYMLTPDWADSIRKREDERQRMLAQFPDRHRACNGCGVSYVPSGFDVRADLCDDCFDALPKGETK